MTQQERLNYLLKYLLSERREYASILIPETGREKRRLLRSLMNLRPPQSISEEFLKIQDRFLIKERESRGITAIAGLYPIREGVYLWQGDITALQADAIVNAANSALLGCFIPCHGCIDNAIHSAAGIQLRLACSRRMRLQATEEKTGLAKITKGYNLPCHYVLHTVGPIIRGKVTEEDCRLLSSSYRSCLELAAAYSLKSIAFCCISTGEFHFPNALAAQIAIAAVKEYLKETQSEMKVVFNVFKDTDYEIYEGLLRADGTVNGGHQGR